MPYHGPSRGCYACKAKKVKCDETIPHCQRCSRAGQECPGYRNPSEVVFHDMTLIAERKVKARKAAGKSAGTESSGQEPTPSGSTSSTALQQTQRAPHQKLDANDDLPTEISRALGTNWQEAAITRFFADYAVPSDAVEGNLQWLPQNYEAMQSCAHFQEALNAVAFVSQANQLGLDWMARDADDAYCRSLSLVGPVLSDPIESSKDSTLGTVLLFHMYETIRGPSMNSVWSTAHYSGLESLLNLRGSNQFQTTNQRSMFRFAYGVETFRSLAGHFKALENVDNWLACFENEDPPQMLAKCNLRTVRLCARAQILFDRSPRDEWWMAELLQVYKDVILLDLQYQYWGTATRDWCNPNMGKSAEQSSGKSQHVYYDLWVAGVWNNWRSVRAHLHEVLLHCITLLESHPSSRLSSIGLEAARTESKRIIADMIGDLFDSLPFFLGDTDSEGKSATTKRLPIGGWLLLFPLHVARCSLEAGSEKDDWVRRKMEFIWKEMGIRQGQILADRPHAKSAWFLR